MSLSGKFPNRILAEPERSRFARTRRCRCRCGRRGDRQNRRHAIRQTAFPHRYRAVAGWRGDRQRRCGPRPDGTAFRRIGLEDLLSLWVIG